MNDVNRMPILGGLGRQRSKLNDEVVNEPPEIFPWNDNFNTGIGEIDVQHRRLVDLLNQLARHFPYQSNLPALDDVFAELTNYAAYHFATEEAVWRKYLSPDAWVDLHENVHRGFLDSVSKLKSQASTQPFENVIEDILSFLTHWLAFHILEDDKRMAHVVTGVKDGLALDQAKEEADVQMSGSTKVLIQTILTMYDSLSARTLQLMKEIVERQKAETKLRLAGNVFDNTLDAICIMDMDTRLIDANPTFHQHCSGEVIGQSLNSLKSGFDDDAFAKTVWDSVIQQGHWSGEITSRAPTGALESEWLTLSAIKDNHGTISNYVAVFSNVTQLMQRQRQLERVAKHDALTGLPNRLLLVDRLDRAIVQAERARLNLAVCFLDLDGFKLVNDRYGHAAGDALLVEVSHRLQQSLRSADTVARLGGDEFVILIGELASVAEVPKLLTKILQQVGEPIHLGGEVVTVTASIGVAIYPADGGTSETLMKRADVAMYRAKSEGKSQFRFSSEA